MTAISTRAHLLGEDISSLSGTLAYSKVFLFGTRFEKGVSISMRWAIEPGAGDHSEARIGGRASRSLRTRTGATLLGYSTKRLSCKSPCALKYRSRLPDTW